MMYKLAAVLRMELDDAVDDGVLFDDVIEVAVLALPPQRHEARRREGTRVEVIHQAPWQHAR